MRPSLLSMLQSSFVIWSRSFALIYVFFLFMLIASLMLGSNAGLGMDTRSLLVWGVLLLIFSALMSGFYYIVSHICQNYLNAQEQGASERLPARKREVVTSAFGLFRNFLPGIGLFFVPVTLGYLIQFGVLGALGWNLNPLWMKAMPVLARTEALIISGKSPESVVSMLSPEQQMDIGQLALGVIIIGLLYAMFGLLTWLWPVFVVMYRNNPLLAYGRSIRQFFRDPFRLIGLSVLFLTVKIVLTLLTLASGMFIDILGRIALLLLEIYMTVVLFVYAWHAIGPPTSVPDEEDEEPTPPPPSQDDEPSDF